MPGLSRWRREDKDLVHVQELEREKAKAMAQLPKALQRAYRAGFLKPPKVNLISLPVTLIFCVSRSSRSVNKNISTTTCSHGHGRSGEEVVSQTM